MAGRDGGNFRPLVVFVQSYIEYSLIRSLELIEDSKNMPVKRNNSFHNV